MGGIHLHARGVFPGAVIFLLDIFFPDAVHRVEHTGDLLQDSADRLSDRTSVLAGPDEPSFLPRAGEIHRDLGRPVHD